MAPLAERLRDGETLRLTHLGGDRFRLDASQRDFLPDCETFPNWILTEESEAGAVARLSFDDYAWKDRTYPPGNLPLALAAVAAVEEPDEAPGAVLRLALKPGRLFLGPQARDDLPAREAVHGLQRRPGPGPSRRARPSAGFARSST